MDLNTIAQNVRRIRLARGMSQKDLAGASGISLPAIKNMERAKAESRTNTLVLIARALGVTLRELLFPARHLHAVRFRYDGKMRSRENILASMSAWLEDYEYLEKVLKSRKRFAMESVIHSTLLAAAMCRKKLGAKAGQPIHNTPFPGTARLHFAGELVEILVQPGVDAETCLFRGHMDLPVNVRGDPHEESP